MSKKEWQSKLARDLGGGLCLTLEPGQGIDITIGGETIRVSMIGKIARQRYKIKIKGDREKVHVGSVTQFAMPPWMPEDGE